MGLSIMKNLPFIILLLTSVSALDGQAVSLNGRQFRMITGQWYQIDNGNQFRVNNAVITVKFLGGVNPQQIAAY